MVHSSQAIFFINLSHQHCPVPNISVSYSLNGNLFTHQYGADEEKKTAVLHSKDIIGYTDKFYLLPVRQTSKLVRGNLIIVAIFLWEFKIPIDNESIL